MFVRVNIILKLSLLSNVVSTFRAVTNSKIWPCVNDFGLILC